MQKTMLNGTTIHYVESGEVTALPVVFIHGFPFSHAMWAPQLDAVAERHRAVAYDLRGHGRSDVGDGQYTVEGHVDDLLALLDHLGIAKAVLVGLSMGGYVALRAAERAPERCRGLVLCDTRSEADGNEAKLKRAAGAVQVKRDGAAAFADGFVKAVFAPGTFTARPEAVEAVRLIIAGTSPLAIAGTLIALAGRTDTTAALPGIAVPTLILVGEHDQVTPPEASRDMHERIPGAQLHVVPEAGHLSSVENPEFFNARLLPFLAQCAG
ncbi:MAG: alpha/beta fold hydrolase [Candidatus Krumholzibacteriia bacterium]